MIVTYPLDEIWPVIVGKISDIKCRYSGVFDWQEMDIYQACKEKRAFIFNNDQDESFAVVKIKHVEGEKVLFIWIAYGVHGKRERNLEFLKQIARSVGTSRMEMESPRKGFDKMPEWKPVITRYSMEV